ncbi:FxLYD domain-containing protein [Kitasatospora sp. NPDC048407]|uniref:FxLYD domain-containing protein n=1 Tax=Kitasatospora sp. NPDC048407 TaxID=3364051 RepID=UPI00370FA2E5
MKRQIRVAAGLAAVLLGSAALAGCTSSGKTSGAATSAAASAAASAAQSVLGSASAALGSAAASLGASAQAAASSAQAVASSALASVKGGLNAKGDVALGAATTESDGKLSVPVTVTNHGSQAGNYTIQVNFDDASGNLLDATVVNVPDVAPGATAQATAHSNRSLNAPVTPVVANALRH